MASELVENIIEIVLIGDSDKTSDFINACEGKKTNFYYSTAIETDTCKYGIDCIQPSSQLDLNWTETSISTADAVIYLNASPEDINAIEKIRSSNNLKTIAIDFNSINLTPNACLEKIIDLQEYFVRNYDSNFEKKKLLISSAQICDNQSFFHGLPKEIVFNEIYEKYEKLATNKFIFFSCPSAVIEKSKNEMDRDNYGFIV